MTKEYTIYGLVQGIGFRPSVKRIADRLDIKGAVQNSGGAVFITACGTEAQLDKFKSEIQRIPQLSITGFMEKVADKHIENGFKIEESSTGVDTVPMLTPDIATCDNCIAEFRDRTNRRYHHPFISCTACGPRYSILEKIPYDRCNTAMDDFSLCTECTREYTEISDTRCHAQTVSCNDCGPVLKYTLSGAPLLSAADTIKKGGVAALKDIGGYHFACLANSESAALQIRKIKHRDRKPFAVMFASVDAIKEYAEVSPQEVSLLLSAARPIVLLRKKKELAPSVCGESDYIGAFLPCNPVQDYLAQECGALVMTSANISGEPIITENDDIYRLRDEIGGFEILSHNRRIVTPLDDSVCRVICGRAQMIRRARGYTPLPVDIDAESDVPVLATGGDLKASFCYAVGKRAYMSQYFGDLEASRSFTEWKNSISHLGQLLGISEYKTISDLHPLYRSKAKNGICVQHHYAHMASVMAEHKLKADALGFVFDGTGYGIDGNIWGGEVILYKNGFNRVGGLEYTELTGGDEAAENSENVCDCFLAAAGLAPRGENRQLISAALENHINTVRSSSMGRLFDAVSALLGICRYNSYEGESAIKLESAAGKAEKPYPLKLYDRDGKWSSRRLIRDIAIAADSGADIKALALGFHRAIGDAVVDTVIKHGIKTVILSGGVFANAILTEMCIDSLTDLGFDVYINEQVPTNDGGIALGQAYIVCNCKTHCNKI